MDRNAHGGFIWYELMTTDLDGTASFYGDVVGWSCYPFDPADPNELPRLQSG